LSDFNGLWRHSRVVESFPALDAEVSLVANRKRKPGFLGFLKNNTTSMPVWQEIVDFS
jgi:hypothetical protein